MERYYNRMDKAKNLDTYAGARRPVKMAYEDLGSSFNKDAKKPQSSLPKPTTGARSTTSRSSQHSSMGERPSSSTSSVTTDRRKTSRVIEVPDDDSDDEMDCLSQQSDYNDPSSSQIPVRKSSPSDSWDIRATSRKDSSGRVSSPKTSYIDSNGTAHEMDPAHLKTSNVLATLKFKKNKKPEDENTECSQRPSSSQPTEEPTIERKRVPLPSRTQSNIKRLEPNARKPGSPTESAVDTPKPRPKPRPIVKGGTGARIQPSSSQTSTTRRELKMVDIEATPRPSGSQRKKDPPRSRSNSPVHAKRAPAKKELETFPAPSPLSTPVKKKRSIEAFPDMSPLAESMSQETDKRDVPPKKSSTLGVPRLFPMSPVSISSPQRASKALPNLKGKAKMEEAKDKKKGKNRKIIESSEEQSEVSEDDSKKKRGVSRRKPAAFPMGTQMLASIGSPERALDWSPVRSVKRSSEGGSGDEHSAKKSKRIQELKQESPTRYPFEEGDSISLDPRIDPKSLCPYCDIPLPSSPSPLLLRLLNTTKLKSYKDARPANPLGRKAPLAVFATVCQRHRFESKLLPEAERKGWPKTIDWRRLEGRIGKMKSQLKALIMQDEGDSDSDSDNVSNDWEVLHASSSRSAKAKSIFWDELLDEIKKKGLKSISGVQGQFDNFEKAQPGYYGELGSVIIHQTLYNIFPPTSIDATIIAPLTVNQFVQRVLVPEVALRLIMEDKGLKGHSGMQKALGILRDSSAYGVAMFPEDTSEPGKRGTKDDADKLGVGDMIVMERARKRRKELEEEEEQERVDEEEEKKAFRQRLRAELKEKEEQALLTDSKESLPGPRPRPKPKPKPVMKSHSRMDMSSTDTEAKPIRYRSPSRSARGARNGMDTDTDASTDEETKAFMKDIHSSSPGDLLNDLRRSLSASETRNEDLFDDTPRRAPNLEVAAMDINASDRRSAGKVNGRFRASSRVPAGSPTRYPTVARAPSRASYRSCSESSSGIEFVPSGGAGPSSEKTPIPRNKVRPPLASAGMDTAEGTPRGSTPPLVKAARRRQQSKSQTDEAKQKSSAAPIKKYARQINVPLDEDFGWLLSSPSQSQ